MASVVLVVVLDDGDGQDGEVREGEKVGEVGLRSMKVNGEQTPP